MKSKKELFCYLFCGGVTTAVNYLLYGGLLFLRLPYIAANSIAWVGAVLTLMFSTGGLFFTRGTKYGRNFRLLPPCAF